MLMERRSLTGNKVEPEDEKFVFKKEKRELM